MSRPRAAALLVAVWSIGAFLATATGLLAVRLVADEVGDEGVTTLSSVDLERIPAPSSTASPAATPTPTPSASAAGPSASEVLSAPATFVTTGGVVGARCSGDTPILLYATPAQGYALHETEREEGLLKVRFEGDDRETRAELGCRDGTPVLLGGDGDGDGGRGEDGGAGGDGGGGGDGG